MCWLVLCQIFNCNYIDLHVYFFHLSYNQLSNQRRKFERSYI